MSDSENMLTKNLIDPTEKQTTALFDSKTDAIEIKSKMVLTKDGSDFDEAKFFKFDNLTKMNIFGYGVGHFINDLAAAGWFNYLTIYLKSINPIDDVNPGFYAGLVLLSGQLADGMATPIVGFLSDKTNTRIGKRMPWYIIGLILVCVCYIFIFQKCLFCSWFGTEKVKIFYYVFFPSLFNVGWASLQIAHMSLVPSLSSSRITRDKMNGMRNTFTYAANFVVLFAALILFIAIETPITQFECLSYIIVALGLCTSIFFMTQINEPKLSKECSDLTKKIKEYLKGAKVQSPSPLSVGGSDPSKNECSDLVKPKNENDLIMNVDLFKNDENKEKKEEGGEEFIYDKKSKSIRHSRASSNNEKMVHWSHWFKDIMFYQYGIVYMCVRLVCNITSSMFNFYLVYVIVITKADLNKETPKELAIVPLVLYAFSVLGSLFLNKLYLKIGRKKTYLLGAICIVGTSIVMIFLTEETNYLIYPVAIFNGFGQSLALNTGIVLISEVIGLRGASGAFVFGAYSFCDKVANGLVLFFILNSAPFETNEPEFIRWMTVIIPSASCLVALIFIMTGKAKDYKQGEEQGLEDEFAQ